MIVRASGLIAIFPSQVVSNFSKRGHLSQSLQEVFCIIRIECTDNLMSFGQVIIVISKRAEHDDG